jgi:hypothetical protein
LNKELININRKKERREVCFKSEKLIGRREEKGKKKKRKEGKIREKEENRRK